MAIVYKNSLRHKTNEKIITIKKDKLLYLENMLWPSQLQESHTMGYNFTYINICVILSACALLMKYELFLFKILFIVCNDWIIVSY